MCVNVLDLNSVWKDSHAYVNDVLQFKYDAYEYYDVCQSDVHYFPNEYIHVYMYRCAAHTHNISMPKQMITTSLAVDPAKGCHAGFFPFSAIHLICLVVRRPLQE